MLPGGARRQFRNELLFCKMLILSILNESRVQRKIPVDLHFLYHRHKADCASPLGVAGAACFEALACVFASADATFEKTDDTLTKKHTILC